MQDKKKIAALIVAAAPKSKASHPDHPDYEDPTAESPEDSQDEGQETAAQEMLDAIKTDDSSKLLEAMKNLIQMCS